MLGQSVAVCGDGIHEKPLCDADADAKAKTRRRGHSELRTRRESVTRRLQLVPYLDPQLQTPSQPYLRLSSTHRRRMNPSYRPRPDCRGPSVCLRARAPTAEEQEWIPNTTTPVYRPSYRHPGRFPALTCISGARCGVALCPPRWALSAISDGCELLHIGAAPAPGAWAWGCPIHGEEEGVCAFPIGAGEKLGNRYFAGGRCLPPWELGESPLGVGL